MAIVQHILAQLQATRDRLYGAMISLSERGDSVQDVHARVDHLLESSIHFHREASSTVLKQFIRSWKPPAWWLFSPGMALLVIIILFWIWMQLP